MAIYSLEPLTARQQSLISDRCGEKFVASSHDGFFIDDINYDDVTCIICRDRDDVQSVLSKCRKLKFLFVVSVGVEKLPFAQLRDRDITVCNVGGINAEIMSQYVMAYLLAESAKVIENHRNQVNHIWKKYQTVEDVSHKVAMIFGAGRVGCLLARKLKAFGVKCVGVKRVVRPMKDFDAVVDLDDARDAIATADYVISLLPVTPLTRGYFDKSLFSLMKNDATFVNISRSSVVKMSDLYASLRAGEIKSAVVDVFDTEPLTADDDIWDIPNLVITPHSSGRLKNFMDEAVDLFCINYSMFMGGRNPPNKINLQIGY